MIGENEHSLETAFYVLLEYIKSVNIYWSFVVPLDAPDTLLDSNEQFNFFIRKFGDKPCTNGIIGHYETNDYNEAPLLLLFCRSKLRAMCVDHVDVMIMRKLLRSTESLNSDSFNMLSFVMQSDSYFPQRIKFANTLLQCATTMAEDHKNDTQHPRTGMNVKQNV